MGRRFVRETRSQGSLRATQSDCYNPLLLLRRPELPPAPGGLSSKQVLTRGVFTAAALPLPGWEQERLPGPQLCYTESHWPLVNKGKTNDTPHRFKRAFSYLTSSLFHLNRKGGMWKELLRPVRPRCHDLFCTEQLLDGSVSSDPSESKASHAGSAVRSETFPS